MNSMQLIALDMRISRASYMLQEAAKNLHTALWVKGEDRDYHMTNADKMMAAAVEELVTAQNEHKEVRNAAAG